MAYIYKITNDINDKVYIGKTEFDIQKRWKEHCADYKKDRGELRPLYNAMRKYGIEHFSISLIEETDNPSEREKYWIAYYDSYYNGYNATKGGDGKRYLDYDKIVDVYQRVQNMQDAAEICGVSPKSVRNIIKQSGVLVRSNHDTIKAKCSKTVCMYSQEDTSRPIKTFNSTMDAAQYLIDNDYSTAVNVLGVKVRIVNACNGRIKNAYGFCWKYAEHEIGRDVPTKKISRVEQYSVEGKLLNTFNNYNEAAQHLIDHGSTTRKKHLMDKISHAASGKQHTAAGYVWKTYYK